jgi:phage-related baseplate assembly protein
MTDVELVLRFFALTHYDEMDVKYKDFLSDFLDRRNKEYKQNQALATSDRALFQRAIENCWIVFGDSAFRKTADAKKSAPLADAVMISLSDYAPLLVTPSAAGIRTAFETLLTGDEEKQRGFQKAFGTGTNGKGAIRTRIELAKEAVRDAIKQ